ncbi:hypothetical protein [Parvularcula dongshanensis]|uniref:DUF2946 domain-containing protein n=1 Tax=Parvularcula dongshanensis TaxID=1173995 RepID=A0A840I1P2_9PROT|nr:hypothetical protein [Parvularcula dongshanensis]MBB4658265.1 hypothetical protein [Parvularcula dongshanensis]
MRLRGLLVVLGLLVALIQGGAAAHAAAFGDGPHDHDGIPCSLQIHGDQTVGLLPPPDAPLLILPLPEPVAKAEASRTLLVPASTVTPPGRAPPFSF